ncbi:acyl-CoA dehydrogenase [Cylindrospermopsis raciborskii S07]|jgi:alkylation response protein AidB-like acyl-CoA dehydrogenase|uniref:Acyl-CoA dehydrogenase n=2 Tax=Cylindrospermopsis raciborskii TaxID=77022 RepID=A0A853MBW2_9CYAN|nr:acyl-CoA/acyl-ACP dehydrogenase [Cylindrospermopsis raciborskii]BAZ91120.1 acyl-CoA dehydrogenase [Raphidiopsis curvata NIES-932]EFA69037.1 hypothetical protein CRC_02398 [Cylindrospermopsis raciborskii CS-505]MBA4447050.1 acyl-CoA/acyl-ACP dehydrogenase [Cylindrospermopsis raciborskii CS-506_C]MBA4451311.1 acyl-CoA/acyl-ACP dehydrogenase [Cylindrospermopsis raciborskii CS-506_D]MBA4457907.1 acyl-CoA/acyl-ACP dehydrogenase [Cylindrospermopsis raciborskii CS-506_B]
MITENSILELQLSQRAQYLNDGYNNIHVGDSLTQLAQVGYLGLGVRHSLGGYGGDLLDVVEAIAMVAGQCLTSGFVFWCQRAFIQYLIASDNKYLQVEILPQVLKGELSGATGLSNAMKNLAGIEKLRIQAQLNKKGIILNGFLPWASNLRPEKFVVAVAAKTDDGRSVVVAIPGNTAGLERGEDLQLLGLQSSWTSTLNLSQVELSQEWIISHNGEDFLPKIRPAFLLMQCGLPLGIARKSLQEIEQSINRNNEQALSFRVTNSALRLSELETQIFHLSRLSALTLSQTRQLFEVRIRLTRLAVEMVQLELESKGGSAYFKSSGTARRLREVAFLPVLTPSLVQLETELYRHAPVCETI